MIHRSLLTGMACFPAYLAAAEEGAAAGAPEGYLSGTPLSGTLVQMLGGLALVVLLIVFLAWFIRRLSGLQQSAAGQMRILGGLSMGTREKIVLIQVGEEQLLVGVAPGMVRTLHRLERPLDVRQAESANVPDFAAGLRRMMKGEKAS